MKLIQKIEDYVAENATEKSLEKGQRISKTILKFGDFNIDMDTQTAEFRIMGTYFYTVKIANILGNITSTCTCPYDHGGICKHQVAALSFLSDYFKRNPEKLNARPKPTKVSLRSEKKRRASEPYRITPYQPLSLSVINRHTVFIPGQRSGKFKVQGYSHKGQTIEFELREVSFFWNYKPKKYIVTFTKKGESLVTVCSCNMETDKLCSHQANILWNVVSEHGENFFEILDPDFIDRQYLELTQKTGIPDHLIREYYEFNFKHRKFRPKEKAKGLISFNGEEGKNTSEKSILPFKKINYYHLPIESGDHQKALEMGYVFSFEKPHEVELIPITGAPSDTEWLKYIKEYSPKNIPLHLNEQDEAILAIIAELDNRREEIWYKYTFPLGTDEVGLQQFYQKRLPRLFELLKEKKYVYIRPGELNGKIKKSQILPFKVAFDRPYLFFELGEESIFYTLKAKLRFEDKVLDLSNPSLDIDEIFPQFPFIAYKNKLYLQPSIQQASTIFELKNDKSVFKCIKRDFDQFYQQIVKPVSANYPIEYSAMEDYKHKAVQLKPLERQLYITELGSFILFKPVVAYDHDKRVNIREKINLLEKTDKEIVTYERDEKFEQEFLDFMMDLHPEFTKQQFNEFFYLPFTVLTRNSWFFNVFEKFTEEGISVFGVNDLKAIQYSPFKANIHTHIKSGEDWFDVEISVAFGDELVKLTDVRKAVMRNERFVKLSDGKMGLLPEQWFTKLQKYFRVGEIEKGELKISKMKFSIVDELFDQIDDEGILLELAEKRARLRDFQEIKDVEIPDEITADLRHYQLEGFNWLNFLDEFRWGGILADDMGLGKTLQVLTFLQQQVLQNKETNLVVVPTTLLFNWENEIQKFAPGLNHHIHHGTDRTANPADLRQHDLIITTYGMVTNDIELLNKIKFNYIVLDESQAIKNPASKRYKAVCLLKGKNKIAMTGTPIENNTFDLYAQLNFLNPGFLGSQQAFKNDFSRPIDGEGDADRARELQKMVKPFVLRRTKEQVANELPPKVEDYLYCNMETGQRRVYDAYRNKYRDYLLNKIEEQGLAKSKLFVLEGLLKLRQICDSPELLNDEEDYGRESVKIKELIKHITEKTGKHKILVFSQFVKMLRLIEKELKKNDIQYEYLDGQCSPKQRQKSVEVFQNDDNYRVFLISLKAGGTGLNLTAADYVYIVDPWWNPAVENQAIDRTHRIGQDKHIIAYRMICKDTIEEKIVNLQKKKLKIAKDIIQTDESFMKSLTREDIEDLFL